MHSLMSILITAQLLEVKHLDPVHPSVHVKSCATHRKTNTERKQSIRISYNNSSCNNNNNSCATNMPIEKKYQFLLLLKQLLVKHNTHTINIY